jgi:regulatory protein
MPVLTQILEQKRAPNRRNIYLDGVFAFGCNVTVVARFRLRIGLELSAEEVEQIQHGEVRQECFDAGLRLIQQRHHSTAEVQRKLARRQQWGEPVIQSVLADLQRLGYLDDARFAGARAASAAGHKRFGRRRALGELLRSGVPAALASAAIESVYGQLDSTSIARSLALKHAARLRRLDPVVARRRLVGMLQRRGFDYDSIAPVVAEVLGPSTAEV